MASADFSLVIQPMRSPQVKACSFLRCLPHLLDKYFLILQAFGLYNDGLAHPIYQASYQVSVPRIRFGAGCQCRSLQSRFLHCMGHPKPACGLLTVRSITSARKRLSLSGIFQTTLPDLSEKFVFFKFIQSIQ